MNLMHLKYFIAVAEELHFGRAAERIGMAQPPLSQAIRRLENALNCRLFRRTQRSVELTAAGEALLLHAPILLRKIQYAQHAALQAKDEKIRELSIGFTLNALSEIVPAAIREIRRLQPDIVITLSERSGAEQVVRLLTGELDVGFFASETPHIGDLVVRLVETTGHVAAIPAEWPLASSAELHMADLVDQPLLLFPPSHSPGYHASLMAAFRQTGHTPEIVQEAAFDHTRLQLVAAGLGVSIVSSSAAPHGHPGVRLVRIVDAPARPGGGVSMAWRKAAPQIVCDLLDVTAKAIQPACGPHAPWRRAVQADRPERPPPGQLDRRAG